MSRVSIVIPVRGAHDALRLCLACVQAHTSNDAPVVVAVAEEEQAAVEEIVCSLEPGAPFVWFTVSDEPETFARNCNRGAAVGDGELIVFLNSDAFVGPGWLDALLAPFADPDVVAVGPVGTKVASLSQLAEPAPEGARFPRTPNEVAEYADLVEWRPRDLPTSPFRVRKLIGFCLAVRRSAWDEAGGFDERFENAYCDDDLSLRLAMAGDLVVVPDLLVLHHGCASFAELPDAEAAYRRTLAENQARFDDKWNRRGLLPFLNGWLDSRGAR